jgi:NCS1 family nucleobase:cation symporter-1
VSAGAAPLPHQGRSEAISGLVELAAPLPASPYVNPDIAPTAVRDRTWRWWHFASLWVGLSVCIPTYMLAAALVEAGMNWWQALVTIVLGNAITLLPMVIHAHAGTRYGIPCGWFGIQTWIGGLAIGQIVGILWPAWTRLGGGHLFMGFGLPDYLGFAAFWLMNLWFIWKGTDSIKWLETLSAPFLIVIGLALLIWATGRVGGLGRILAASGALVGARGAAPRGLVWFFFHLFLPWVTAMVGYWATLSLNIPDFTRYARSQKDQMVGQALGLLTTMPLYAFIGVAVTSATVMLYGRAIWNPVELVGLLSSTRHDSLLGLLALAAILVATLTTSLAANIVGPGFTISNLSPRRISFRAGGLIAAAIGVLIVPWKLLEQYQTWLISYSGLLGAAGGVLVCDYAVLRRGALRLAELYVLGGAYGYRGGINRRAMIALVAGVATALAGLLTPALRFLFDGAWFSAAIVSFGLYWWLMRRDPSLAPAAEPATP